MSEQKFRDMLLKPVVNDLDELNVTLLTMFWSEEQKESGYEELNPDDDRIAEANVLIAEFLRNMELASHIKTDEWLEKLKRAGSVANNDEGTDTPKKMLVNGTALNRFAQSQELKGEQSVEAVKEWLKKDVRTQLNRADAFTRSSQGKDPGLYRVHKSHFSNKYKPHSSNGVQLTYLQEYFMFLQMLRTGWRLKELARTYFRVATDATIRRTRSVLRTWIAGMYEILKVEDLWVYAKDMYHVTSSAFEDTPDILFIADCSKQAIGSSSASRDIRQQTHSIYYGTTVGKYAVACSVIGGTVAVGHCMGGPAEDYECLDQAGLFDKKKYERPVGQARPRGLYDAGVHNKTITAALEAGFVMETSGRRRQSAASVMSLYERQYRYGKSKKRIRVEDFIGIVKKKFQILTDRLPATEMGFVDKIVFVCYALHNFGFPIID